jgi:RIO kinase 1
MTPTSTIVSGQFDDAPECGLAQTNGHQGREYADTTEDHEALAWSDDDEGDTDEDESDESYDEDRVEDEDWEITERGKDALLYLIFSEVRNHP